MELALHRMEVGVARHSMDKVDRSGVQVHNAKPESLPEMTVHTRCSTECHMHLGNSWSGQSFQIRVSLDAGDGGKISLAKTES